MKQSPSWETNGRSACKKIPRLLWNAKVFIVFIRNRHSPLSRWIQSILLYPIHMRLILTSSFHFALVSQVISSVQTFQLKFCMHFCSNACYISRSYHHPRLANLNNIIWCRVQIMKLLVMQFCPTPVFLPLRCMHCPQHALFKYSQCKFFS
jgi:hypothetical protein